MTNATPDTEFVARTPLIPGVNADEEHIRAVRAFIRPHKNVIDYELDDYQTPSAELVAKLQAIIDEARV